MWFLNASCLNHELYLQLKIGQKPSGSYRVCGNKILFLFPEAASCRLQDKDGVENI